MYMKYQKMCVEHYMKMKGEYYSDVKKEEVFETIVRDVVAVKGIVSRRVFQIFTDVIISICLFGFLLYLQWDLLLIILSTMPVYYFAQRYFQKKCEKLAIQLRECASGITGLLENFIFNIVPFTYSRSERYFNKRYNHIINDYFKKAMDIDKTGAKNSSALSFLMAFYNMAQVTYGGMKVILGSLSIGGFMTFYMYSMKMLKPAMLVSQVIMEFQSVKVSLAKIYDFIETPIIESGEERLESKHVNRNSVDLSDVAFAYGNKQILKDINIKLEEGTINAIVGESGCGKSTIISLLYRMWDAADGKIQINDKDIQDYELTSLRENISIVSQDMHLFNDTILNNLILGSDVDMLEVERITKLTSIYDLIVSLPDGFNTIIGDRGIKLSGGEKQRICLARTLLRDSKVIVLDEATSALDQLTEKKILDNLKSIVKDKVVIVITHGLNSIVEFDNILVMQNGEIIGNGHHQELIESNSYYYKLYNREYEIATITKGEQDEQKSIS